MIKVVFVLAVSVFSGLAFGERFDGIIKKVTEVGGYSQTSDFAQNHCVIYFDSVLPSACTNKTRGIVYLDKSVGNVMCSVALSALATDKSVKVSSFDDCDPIHNSPILRWFSVLK
ncbi:hypothetical protein [Agaribacterium sp. ZY112]|uniref:hypothetical protein n=1 Tax=Agaribacterium sp. ZY112 TaxID=3233574 RepID=UPI0035240B3A